MSKVKFVVEYATQASAEQVSDEWSEKLFDDEHEAKVFAIDMMLEGNLVRMYERTEQ